ncbi:MAG: polymer-forming cytoskeletal protein [Deltaproteobacteria bacterium]|nr:polymer-forming cytoskeletal protein [Deltaproteobacteria bacterium]
MTVVEKQTPYGSVSSVKGNIIEGSKIIGTVELASGMQVDGEIKGKIYSDGEIFIGVKSKIEGNVVTRKIKVFGSIVGDILAEECIELCVPAVVKGNIAASKIIIQDGVVFSGGCEMQNPENTVKINEI